MYFKTYKNLSGHSLRKCFGREIFNRSGSNIELAIEFQPYIYRNYSIESKYSTL